MQYCDLSLGAAILQREIQCFVFPQLSQVGKNCVTVQIDQEVSVWNDCCDRFCVVFFSLS